MSVAVWNCHSALGGSISQSRFICQVVCTGIQGISTWLLGGPSAKVCSSAKCCVLAFKAYMLYLGGPMAKVGSSAKCCVLIFKASMLYLWGVHWPKKVHLPSTSLTSRWGVHQPKKVHLPSTSLASRWGVHQPKKVHLPNLSSLAVLCFASQKVFSYYIWKT